MKSLYGWSRLVALAGLLFLINACGGSSSGGAKPMGVLPKAMLKPLTTGTLSAALEVYTSDGEIAHQENLSVDANTGEVYSSSFELNPATSYGFLVTFYYQTGDLPNLALAFVAKNFSTQDSGDLVVGWEEGEIIYFEGQADPSLASGFPAPLPSLDQDLDGESNFVELQNGTIPTDSQSLSARFYVEENVSRVHRCLAGGQVYATWDLVNPGEIEQIKLARGNEQEFLLAQDVKAKTDDTGHGQVEIVCEPQTPYLKLEVVRKDKLGNVKIIKLSPVFLTSVNSGDVISTDHQFVFDDQGLTEPLRWKFTFDGIDMISEDREGEVLQFPNLKPRTDYMMYVELKNEKDEVISRRDDWDFTTRDSRMVGWWRFKEGQGGVLRDDSGYNHPINLIGPYSWDDDVWVGSGVLFNNDSDYGRATGGVHASADQITVEVLMRYDGGNSYAVISQNGEYRLQINQGKFQVDFLDEGDCGELGFIGNPNVRSYFSSISLKESERYYVVFTYNDMTGFQFFINGQEDKDVISGQEVKLPLNTDCGYDFGLNFTQQESQNPGTLGQTQALITEVVVYREALSLEEILQNCDGLCS